MANEYYNANPAVSGNPAFGLASRQYSAEYLEGLYAPKSAWKKLLNKSEMADKGESVSVTVMPALSAVDVNQSTGTFAYVNTSITKSDIVISHEKATAVKLTRPVIKSSVIDVMALFAKELGKSISDSIDNELCKLFASMTTNSVGSVGAAFSETYALAALGKMVENNISLSDPSQFVWVLPSSQYAAVKGLKDYGNYTINAGSTGTEGSADVVARIDTLYGIDVVFRTDSAMDVTGGKLGALLHRDSVGVAISKTPGLEEPVRIPGGTAMEVVATALFGIDILDLKRCVLIQTA